MFRPDPRRASARPNRTPGDATPGAEAAREPLPGRTAGKGRKNRSLRWLLTLAIPLAAAAACTSTDVSLGVGPVGGPASAGPASEQAAGTGLTGAPFGPIQFLPVVGAPADTVEALSKALGETAAANGIALAPQEAPAPPYRLKGYLSALEEGRQTVVVYVWDVVDPAGNRVSRIQGQERTNGSADDPWANVGGATLRAIAARTLADVRRLPPQSGDAG